MKLKKVGTVNDGGDLRRNRAIPKNIDKSILNLNTHHSEK